MLKTKEIKNIYFMGIGGTAMGALACLLKTRGFNVRGSDAGVYSPIKEKLQKSNIEYQTPYDEKNLEPFPDHVIVGNVIRKDNPENTKLLALGISYDSFPSFLYKTFMADRFRFVVSGTHGKTTCSSLMAHTLFSAGVSPGFLIGGIPKNFGEGCMFFETKGPFVVEGDEYDTAYFDKQPKFMHYKPNILLVTSLEFDHADIYQDLSSVIQAFAGLFSSMDKTAVIIANAQCENIKKALLLSKTQAKIISYGENGDFSYENTVLDEKGITAQICFHKKVLGTLNSFLFGRHNLMNMLGVYACLYSYGLNHEQIAQGFASFLGVKRRLDEIYTKKDLVVIDDFAHHPTAVYETILATKQKYPHKKILAVFEPRSATSCLKIFEKDFVNAFLLADQVFLAPLGRNIPKEKSLDTQQIADDLNKKEVKATAFTHYEDLAQELNVITDNTVVLFMSNGDFKGLLLRYL